MNSHYMWLKKNHYMRGPIILFSRPSKPLLELHLLTLLVGSSLRIPWLAPLADLDFSLLSLATAHTLFLSLQMAYQIAAISSASSQVIFWKVSCKNNNQHFVSVITSLMSQSDTTCLLHHSGVRVVSY